jgi:predicted nucleic acid-binding protein
MNAEEAPAFVDTNVWVYALAEDDPVRAPTAQELIRRLMLHQALHTSTQVLQELYVTLTRKVRGPIPADQVLRYLERIAAWPVTVVDYEAIRSAIALSSRHQISFWDALIVVAASLSGAQRLYTEDLNSGQVLLGVEIVNPFREVRS